MKVWLPFVVGGGGADVFTRTFATFLERAGHFPVVHRLPHLFQYAPDALRTVRVPSDVDVALTNSWNGFAFRRLGMPMVTIEHLCVHDPAYAPFRSRGQAAFHDNLVRRFEEKSFAAAIAVVAPSEDTRRAVAESFPGVDATVIRHGVDTAFFSPPGRPSSRANGEPFRLLFVGNLTVRKGADLLPSIMESLGPGYLLEYTTGSRRHVSSEICHSHSLGLLDHTGVRDAYRRADALLCPTRLDSGPLVAFEAMACGLPVIGSDTSSMPEAVVHGETGLLSPLDPQALADSVRVLARDPDLCRRMSLAARKRVAEGFSIQAMIDRYVDLFMEIMA